jgi:hypothetical protein
VSADNDTSERRHHAVRFAKELIHNDFQAQYAVQLQNHTQALQLTGAALNQTYGKKHGYIS